LAERGPFAYASRSVNRRGDPVSAQQTEQPDLRDERESELLLRELERRLAWMTESDEAEFGAFTRLDWWICTLCFFVLPLVVVWWMA
jgi:hypothetical protein